MAPTAESLLLQVLAKDGITLTTGLTTVALFLTAYLVIDAIYSVTLHPLASYPGPISTAISRLPWWWSCITGDQVKFMVKLHTKYGPVVRFSPNDLSYVDQSGETWKDIYGYEKGKEEFVKAQEWFVTPHNGVNSLISAGYEDHRRMRRLFSPAFSDRGLRQQRPLFQKHTDRMVARIAAVAETGKPLDMVRMYNATTFDIMGELTFGQSLGKIDDEEYAEWISSIFRAVKVIPFVQIIQYYPWLNALFNYFEPQFIKKMKNNHHRMASDRVDKRIERGSDQPDIWNLVESAQEGQGLSLKEMHSNGEFLILAGSETTATLLSGLTYNLIQNPIVMQTLTREIRSSFAKESDIAMDALTSLPYLDACMHENMRLYPAVPIGVPRVVPEGGRIIDGRYVSAGLRVSVHHYSTFHDPGNFKNPYSYAPERWLGDPLYKDDHRKTLQPFSVGPRNCLGQNMALNEMRLLIARVLYKFDLELCEESQNWTDQKVYALWEKKPLICKVKLAAA
ncbi:cytochrome P450 [Bombardia bombarda]|uniref:Cytochrome P450 n=1 Tax=Bombardia bombarda TaxID=252184 RepID=A0AA40C927_9PEZI|nr:cytochrome P450 [Bombardia bombarda]